MRTTEHGGFVAVVTDSELERVVIVLEKRNKITGQIDVWRLPGSDDYPGDKLSILAKVGEETRVSIPPRAKIRRMAAISLAGRLTEVFLVVVPDLDNLRFPDGNQARVTTREGIRKSPNRYKFLHRHLDVLDILEGLTSGVRKGLKRAGQPARSPPLA